MSDHTFHTPSFGDEEFDIPVDIHHASQPPIDQYQMHGQITGMINNQQGYGQHQWTPQAAESHMMAPNQTFHNLQPPTNHSTFHQLSSPNQQMLMMQPPQQTHQQAAQPNQHQQQQVQPQMSPQMSGGGNNYIGQSSPQTAPINSHENGSTSDDSDDNAVNDPNNAFKSQPKEPDAIKGGAKKTAKAPAKKKKKDPNEPQKPVSAYALFFRDTQAAIKGQNPNASFGEVSKIVASMWDVLAPEHKNVYKKKQEAAKKDYLKAIAAYRAGNLQQATEESSTVTGSQQQNPTVPQQQTIQNTQTVQNFPSQTMTQSYQQPQSYVNQQTVMNQNVMQVQNNVMMNMPNQQTQQIIVSQQQQQINQPQNQYMNNQQIQQIAPTQQNYQQQPLQMINNNANQMPPVQMQQQAQPQLQNCIRNGCTNRAIVSVDWEDEYCSNECVILHCRDVFGNWIHNNSNNQQQNFSTVK
ncbi:TOX high mobility group box family member 4-A-like isoform X2 [Chironomus tepperi]